MWHKNLIAEVNCSLYVFCQFEQQLQQQKINKKECIFKHSYLAHILMQNKQVNILILKKTYEKTAVYSLYNLIIYINLGKL